MLNSLLLWAAYKSFKSALLNDFLNHFVTNYRCLDDLAHNALQHVTEPFLLELFIAEIFWSSKMSAEVLLVVESVAVLGTCAATKSCN